MYEKTYHFDGQNWTTIGCDVDEEQFLDEHPNYDDTDYHFAGEREFTSGGRVYVEDSFGSSYSMDDFLEDVRRDDASEAERERYLDRCFQMQVLAVR